MTTYQPDIDRMTWSYSRIKAFVDCPYRWYLRYIRGLPGKDLFFASYGTFLHRLLAQYYKGEASPDQLCKIYLQTFRQAVSGHAPSPAVFSAYFSGGLQYLRCLQPLPYRVLAVEQRLDFQINGIPCVGYVDVLGERDGQFCIIDHKSKQLKPRSRRAKPTKADKVLDSYFQQLYLYAAGVQQAYGRLPQTLCLNCFRVPALIEEPFCQRDYESSLGMLTDIIHTIQSEPDFPPDGAYFKCTYLCDMQDHCDYYRLF